VAEGYNIKSNANPYTLILYSLYADVINE